MRILGNAHFPTYFHATTTTHDVSVPSQSLLSDYILDLVDSKVSSDVLTPLLVHQGDSLYSPQHSHLCCLQNLLFLLPSSPALRTIQEHWSYGRGIELGLILPWHLFVIHYC